MISSALSGIKRRESDPKPTLHRLKPLSKQLCDLLTSVLNIKPVTFFTKSTCISLLRLKDLPVSFFGPITLLRVHFSTVTKSVISSDTVISHDKITLK